MISGPRRLGSLFCIALHRALFFPIVLYRGVLVSYFLHSIAFLLYIVCWLLTSRSFIIAFAGLPILAFPIKLLLLCDDIDHPHDFPTVSLSPTTKKSLG